MILGAYRKTRRYTHYPAKTPVIIPGIWVFFLHNLFLLLNFGSSLVQLRSVYIANSMPLLGFCMGSGSNGTLPRNSVALSSVNLAKGHRAAPSSSRPSSPKYLSHSRLYATGNETSHTNFTISPPGQSNALWNDDDVLEVPSLQDQLYPRLVYYIMPRIYILYYTTQPLNIFNLLPSLY